MLFCIETGQQVWGALYPQMYLTVFPLCSAACDLFGHSLGSPPPRGSWEVPVKGDPAPHCSLPHPKLHSTLCSIIEVWLHLNLEGFLRSWDLDNLKILSTFLSLTMPESEVTLHVQRLLTQLEN